MITFNIQPAFSNNNIIFEQLKSKLIKKYITESKYIINYYNYYKLKYINYPPDKMIKNIINDYKNEKNYDKILIYKLNLEYYTENKKLVGDIDISARKLLNYIGFSDNHPMEYVCMWHLTIFDLKN